MAERENFHIRMDLQVEAESGGQILGALNNLLINSGTDGAKFKLLGMVIGQQRIPLSNQLQNISPMQNIDSDNLSRITSKPEPDPDPQVLTDLIGQISEAVRSGSLYLPNADTTDKLTRVLPGLTKENLYYWERKGLIHPGRNTRGKKTWRVYSASEALKVAYIVKHTRYGNLVLQSAAEMAGQEVAKIMESQ